jgi:hypothetical protein
MGSSPAFVKIKFSQLAIFLHFISEAKQKIEGNNCSPTQESDLPNMVQSITNISLVKIPSLKTNKFPE